VLPVLGALEEKRRDDPVVVIGVHSAKFDAEADPERIRDAISRHGVHHPVIVDEAHRIWESYAIRSWPTLAVIHPDGTLLTTAPGEADFDALDAFVEKVLLDAREDGVLARTPFRLSALPSQAPGILAFPGKVIALSGDRLAVSESGRHRVLIVDADGEVEVSLGSGEPGFSDGPFVEARLRHPQGLAYDGDTDVLYIADTGNHAIREADLTRRLMKTVAGTGSLGRGIPRGPVPGRPLPLRSPWDVAVAGDFVLVAMAGVHQIWRFSRVDETIAVLAGTGRESIEDGLFAAASFAQPSGLALDGARLYVADSETSAVRYLDMVKGEVQTLVGTGLFDFGDRDGAREQARLQHPLGISSGAAGLLVADSYNDKIKAVNPETGETRTFFVADGDVSLREPGGLCQLDDGRVVVADTNHHRLVRLSKDGSRAEVLTIRSDQDASLTAREPVAEEEEVRTLRTLSLASGDVTLRLRLETPEGFDLAEGSQVAIRVATAERFVAPADDQGFEVRGQRRAVPLLLRVADGETKRSERGAIELRVEATLCSHGEAAACWPVRSVYRLPFRIAASAPPAAEVRLPLPDPRAAPSP